MHKHAHVYPSHQVVVLCTRMLRNWLRNPIMLASECVQYVFMSVFVGEAGLGFLMGEIDHSYACGWCPLSPRHHLRTLLYVLTRFTHALLHTRRPDVLPLHPGR